MVANFVHVADTVILVQILKKRKKKQKYKM